MLEMPKSSTVVISEVPEVSEVEYRAVPPDAAHPDVCVVGTVDAPIDLVWKLFRPFGPDIMRWWPIYDWVKLEPPGIDDVGAVRHFKSSGRIYRERLVYRDDATFTEQYAFVDTDVPIPIESILTTVQFRSLGLRQTEVRWSSRTKVNLLFLPVVKYTQRVAYYSAIESLARYFNPTTELLELRIHRGRVLPIWGVIPPNAYVSVHVGAEPAQRTRIRPLSTHPKWSEDLVFNLGALDRKVHLSVWNASVGKDDLLGTATIDVPSALSTDWAGQTILLQGPQSGELDVSIRLRPEFQVLRESMVLAKTLGARLGKVLPKLGQLGFEIGLIDTAFANMESMASRSLSPRISNALGLTNGAPVTELAGTLLFDMGRAATAVQNVIEGLTEKFVALTKQIMESIRQGEQPVYEYARYTRSRDLPDVPLENLPRMVKGLPLRELLSPAQLGGMMQRGLEYAYSEFYLLQRYKDALLQRKDRFEAFFEDPWVKRQNAIVDHWKDDTEFCRQLIQGVNPLVIRRVRSLTEIPPSLSTLSAQGKSLEELIKDRRLFILDYVELSKLKLYKNMVFYAPIVLVYLEFLEGGEEGTDHETDDIELTMKKQKTRLNLLGIQLTRNKGANVVYTATTSPPNRYLFAKIQVQCADNQYHQFIYHLGIAHLAMEPFVIAHHNAFYYHKEHPIGKLLAPHFSQTIGINYVARQTLVASKAAFTDQTFAPGTAQALQLFLAAWEKYNFTANSFPEDMAARGFDVQRSDGLDGYYYRDDGFKVWTAIETYVGEIVNTVYPNDGAMVDDPVLQNWATETSDPDRAAIPGFPQSFTSRTQLIRALTSIIFQASCFHSAVNFPQYDYLTYVPNRPDSTLAKMPEGEEDITLEFIFNEALPNFFVANFQISFAVLLTTPPTATLWSNTAMQKEYPDIYNRFKDSLQKIANEIDQRNRALVTAGKQPYPYLNPMQVPTSVAI